MPDLNKIIHPNLKIATALKKSWQSVEKLHAAIERINEEARAEEDRVFAITTHGADPVHNRSRLEISALQRPPFFDTLNEE